LARKLKNVSKDIGRYITNTDDDIKKAQLKYPKMRMSNKNGKENKKDMKYYDDDNSSLNMRNY